MIEKNKQELKILLVESGGTIIGSIIIAIGIAQFLLPNQLSSGGFSGIATITYYLFNIPMGIMILLTNIPFFLFSIYQLGKTYFIKSILGTMSLSFFIDFFDRFPPLTEDRLLASIYGGVIIGVRYSNSF